MPQPRQKAVNLNVKVTETTIRALSRTAALRDTTQKEVLMRALLKAVIEIDPHDLGENARFPGTNVPDRELFLSPACSDRQFAVSAEERA